MRKIFFFSFSEKSTRLALFIFFSLLIFSTALFVFADDIVNTKNIFQDSDQDGLSNDEEKLYGTNPFVKDSDGDGYGDGVEVESGYDPLKPAPGDKIVKPTSSELSSPATQVTAENLTQKTSSEIAALLENNKQNGKEISLEDVDAAVQKVLDGSNTGEVTLPEINIADIKIKKGPPKNFSEEKRKKQERNDAIEYLTVVAYIMANNSPHTFQTEDDLSSMLTNLTNDSIAALSSGNMESINQLSTHGEKILGELKDIEVPEAMLDTHIKALKMAMYATQLKDELKASQDDPLGQIAVLSKSQGLLGSIMGFINEAHQKLVDYGIQEIPLNL